MNVILEMLFLTFSNADIQFAEEKLIWRSYITGEVLLTNQRVELIDKKNLAKAALDESVEAFIVHMASLISEMSIYPAEKAPKALLVTEETTIPAQYTDYTNVFSK